MFVLPDLSWLVFSLFLEGSADDIGRWHADLVWFFGRR